MKEEILQYWTSQGTFWIMVNYDYEMKKNLITEKYFDIIAIVVFVIAIVRFHLPISFNSFA